MFIFNCNPAPPNCMKNFYFYIANLKDIHCRKFTYFMNIFIINIHFIFTNNHLIQNNKEVTNYWQSIC